MVKSSTAKIAIFSFAIFLVAAFYIPQEAFATVGGGQLLTNFRYDNDTFKPKVYFLEETFGERGCGGEIKSYDLKTQETSTVISCDLLFEHSALFSKEQLKELLAPLTPLPRIDLQKNYIDVMLEGGLGGGTNEYLYDSTDFKATIRQSGAVRAVVNFKGCGHSPINFIGFSIPGTNELAVVVSTVNQCYEAGFVGEEMVVVGGITVYDATPLGGAEERIQGDPLSYPYPSVISNIKGSIFIDETGEVQERAERPEPRQEEAIGEVEATQETDLGPHGPNIIVVLLFGAAVAGLAYARFFKK